MNKTVTFGHILTVLAIIIIPLMVWGINVERRFEHVITNSEDINELKINYIQSSNVIQKNHIEVMEQFHKLELQLKDKEDRE